MQVNSLIGQTSFEMEEQEGEGMSQKRNTWRMTSKGTVSVSRHCTELTRISLLDIFLLYMSKNNRHGKLILKNHITQSKPEL